MSKGVTFSDMLIGIAQQYKKNNHKYSKEINNQINILKSKQLLPSKLNRDDILITSWAWNEVVESKTKKFEPAQMLNDIYQSPQKTVHHLDNIITLINSNIFDSQVKKVTNLSQKRFVRMEIDKELLLETEVFLTKEFIGCILGKRRNNSELLSGYQTNREFVDDWFEYVSAAEDVGWLRFRGGFDSDLLMEAVYDMPKVWQKMVKKMRKTRKKFPLHYLTEEYGLDYNEQTIIMYLLKNELEGQTCEIEKIKQTISQNRCDLLKHQSYFEDESKLIANSLIELESLHGFKSAFEITLCPDIVLKLMDEKSIKPKNQIKELLQGNDIFSFREPEQSFESLILDREKKDILLHSINQYQNNITNTLIEWGVYNSKQTGKNQGLLILLYGPPGTGKTYCAHTIANYLNKSLLTTDISRILSCYVGMSEQNLRRLFSTYDKIYKR
ncbi:MAG: AAA family ATPase, partial [bacterium]